MAYNNESDRRSNVSSFYGGRKSSLDALNANGQDLRSAAPHAQGSPSGVLARGASSVDRPGATAPHSARSVASQQAQEQAQEQEREQEQDQARARRDSASSFFDPRRMSHAGGEMLAQSAGYNRASFFDVGIEAPVKGGRDEEEGGRGVLGGRGGRGALGGRGGVAGGAFGAAVPAAAADPNDAWDVYADFNNAGPRYSTAFVNYDEGYVFCFYYFISCHNADVSSQLPTSPSPVARTKRTQQGRDRQRHGPRRDGHGPGPRGRMETLRAGCDEKVRAEEREGGLEMAQVQGVDARPERNMWTMGD